MAIPIVERENSVSINLFGLDDKNTAFPVKIVNEEREDHRDILSISNEETNHYCYITIIGAIDCLAVQQNQSWDFYS